MVIEYSYSDVASEEGKPGMTRYGTRGRHSWVVQL